MNSVGASWRIGLKDNIRSSEEAIHRLRERQRNREMARDLLSSAVNAPRDAHVNASRHFPVSYPELEDKVNTLQSQVKNCVTELETERAVRCGSLHELQLNFSNQIGEMRAMLQQVRKENEYLTETVRLMEKRLSSSSSSTSAFAGDKHVDAGGRAPPNSSAAAVGGGGVSLDLIRRVEELESAVTRQRRLVEDRQARLDVVLREMVGARVDSGMERMRSVARDAARDSVEDLLRLRLAAVQNMFNSELQNVMQSAGVAAEVASVTERLFCQKEKEILQRVHELGSVVDAVSHNSRKHEASLGDMETRIMERVAAVERAVEASRREMQDGIAKNAQAAEERTSVVQLAVEANLAERINVACKAIVKKEDMAAAVAEVTDRLQTECNAIRDCISAEKRVRETAAEEHRKHVVRAEKQLATVQDAAEVMQQQIAHIDKLATGVKGEVDNWKARLREAATMSEEARSLAEESAACAQKAEDATREGFARTGAELKRLAQEGERNTSQIRQLNDRMNAAEARHAAESLALEELSERYRNTLPTLSAKMEAVHRTVQDVCISKLEEMTQSITELQAHREQLQMNVSATAKADARQFSDLRRELSSGVQGVEDRVMQALRDAQQESSTAVNGLRVFVDGMNSSAKAHEKLFVSKATLDMVSDRFTEKLMSIENKVDAVLHQKKEQEDVKTQPQAQLQQPLLSASTVGVEAYQKTEQELKNLRHYVDAERSTASERIDMQNEINMSIKEEVESFKRLLHRLREDTSSRIEKLHVLLREEVEDRSQRAEETAQMETRKLQGQINRLSESLVPRRIVSAIRDNEDLLNEMAEALRGVFASSATSDSIAEVKKRIQQAEQHLSSLDAHRETQEHEFAHRMYACESSQRLHAEQLQSLESHQKTVEEMNKRWRDETREESKREVEMLTVHFDENMASLQRSAMEVELQTRTLQLTLRGLQEEQVAMRQELTKMSAGELQSIGATAKEKKKRNENEDNLRLDDDGGDEEAAKEEDGVWKAQVEERLCVLEKKIDAMATSTADAFDGLHDGIAQCVALFVQEATPTALFQESNTSAAQLAGLDDLFLFLLGQLCQVFGAVQALQNGAMGTLDLVQHHEEQLSLLSPLRSLAVRSARRIGKLAGAMGIPPDLHIDSRLIEEKEDGDNDDDIDDMKKKFSASV